MNAPGPIVVDSDPARLDLAVVHGFLAASYWARGIPLAVVERAIRQEIDLDALSKDMTDRATFAYLADVFVLDSHRGRGLSKRLMDAVVAHPELQGLRRWMLATRDAHGLYAQYGFTAIAAPEPFMQRHDPDVYARAGGA